MKKNHKMKVQTKRLAPNDAKTKWSDASKNYTKIE